MKLKQCISCTNLVASTSDGYVRCNECAGKKYKQKKRKK